MPAGRVVAVLLVAVLLVVVLVVAVLLVVAVARGLTRSGPTADVLDAVEQAGVTSGGLDLVAVVGGPGADAVAVLCPYQPAGSASEQLGVDVTDWARELDDTASSLVVLSGDEVTRAVELPTASVDACSALQTGDGVPVLRRGASPLLVVPGDAGGARWRLQPP